MPKIGFIPLDNRPCTKNFPEQIAQIAGNPILLPPLQSLGQFLTPGQPGQIKSWVRNVAQDLDYLIVSIDMLTYGGLIGSRTPKVDKKQAIERLDVLRELKKLNPALQIYAWNVLMRISITVHDDLTAQYWEQMNRFSVLWSQNQENILSKKDQDTFLHLQKEIPSTVQNTYFQARERNHAVNQHSLSLVDEGVIDVLIFCQEDAHPIGPHKIEQRQLLKNIKPEDLHQKIFLHPGADESGLNLLARAFCHYYQKSPTISHGFFPEEARNNIPIFEDMPLEQSVISQSLACGLSLSEDNSDLWGAVYGPSQTAQGLEVWQHKAQQPAEELLLESLWSEIKHKDQEGSYPMIFDVRIPNGSDPTLLSFLQGKDNSVLASYAGWNTAGNTIGTALAQGTIYALAKSAGVLNEQAQIEFMIGRILDDYVYQKIIRDELAELINQNTQWGTTHHLNTEGWKFLNALVQEQLQKWANEWLGKYGLPTAVVRARLPWPRIFEVEVLVELQEELTV